MRFNVAPVRWGLMLAMFSLLMGVYLGIQFGKNEDEILANWKTQAQASAVFGGDEKKIDATVQSGWKYLQRSHEHFQGLGAIALGVCLLVAALPLQCRAKSLLSIGVALGGFIYPLFWYLVAYRCAYMDKHAAKESLALMAQGGAGLYFVSLLGVSAAVLIFAIWRNDPPTIFKRVFKTGEQLENDTCGLK